MKQRVLDPEIIDLGSDHYTINEYNDFLTQLGRIGKYLGTDAVMLKLLGELPFSYDSILDVGCGGGLFTLQIARKFKEVNVVGIDIAQEAISYAQSQKQIFEKNVVLNNLKFELRNDPNLNEPNKSYDIVTCSLLLHHLSDDNIIEFLKRSSLIARKAIIINDLHRHRIAYCGFAVCSQLCFRNRLICNDGLLSIKKAFQKKDLIHYLKCSGLKNYKITWHWPFRWIVVVNLT